MAARRSVTVALATNLLHSVHPPHTMASASSVSFPSNITCIFPQDYHCNSTPSPIPLLESQEIYTPSPVACQSHRDMYTPSPVLPQYDRDMCTSS